MEVVVFSAAIMDLMHEGHINLLNEMRGTGDRTIMVLHDDASCFAIKGKVPIQSLAQRIRNLEISGLVDEILVADTIDPAPQFGLIIGANYDNELIFMRGDDNLNPPGGWILDKMDIEQRYVHYTQGVSSTLIRDGLI
jgi:cytidyltransferase-like protein